MLTTGLVPTVHGDGKWSRLWRISKIQGSPRDDTQYFVTRSQKKIIQ